MIRSFSGEKSRDGLSRNRKSEQEVIEFLGETRREVTCLARINER